MGKVESQRNLKFRDLWTCEVDQSSFLAAFLKCQNEHKYFGGNKTTPPNKLHAEGWIKK